MRRLIVACIKAYQIFLSPLRVLLPLGGLNGCRFHPSCSHYASEAVTRFGTARGLALAARRLSRCHPWHTGGYDPVPQETACAHNGCSHIKIS